jgi:hypothetical protein
VRLYVVSDLAGALEPCGCVKDQLGGLNHAAAWIEAQRKDAPDFAVAAAGPLFFMDPVIKPERKAQELLKAHALARSLAVLDAKALYFTPGKNDYALGPAELTPLVTEGRASLVGASPPLSGASPLEVRAFGPVKVAFVGVAAADVGKGGGAPPADAVKKAVADAKAQGANVIVALAAVGRGEAKRIADLVPDLTAIVVGSPEVGGEANTTAPITERIGNVLIAQTSNHLQTMGVLDLYVRGEAKGPIVFADASGLEAARKKEELTQRIDELHGKIAAWEKDAKIAPADLVARRADLAKLEAERTALDTPPPPKAGSFFRWRLQEVRESLGHASRVDDELTAYYRKVNDTNRVDFASKLPPPPERDGPSYVGVEACSNCHEAPRRVWNGTRHAHAYATLATQFKEYNLDCVGCHVTGYEEPGGSNVTHVAALKDVQCEVCHGPGSKHAKNPKVAIPTPNPGADRCLSCHHAPHVAQFDAAAKMAEILGPGHGG